MRRRFGLCFRTVSHTVVQQLRLLDLGGCITSRRFGESLLPWRSRKSEELFLAHSIPSVRKEVIHEAASQ